jgi:hypothetical protein
MWEFMGNPQVLSALISASVAFAAVPLAQYLFGRLSLRYKLQTEYEYEQRKKLRELIGSYHGRMLEAATSLHHRFENLYTNVSKKWLAVEGDYKHPAQNYYFTTTVYRFLVLCVLARKFEAEAMFIDGRIAEKKDLEFLKYIKAFYWAATDVALFDGLKYDFFRPTDHFFGDQLRMVCDVCWADGSFISLLDFQGLMIGKNNGRLLPALAFFDGLCSGEKRLRWDRVVALHLVVMAFVNTFGYEMQRSSMGDFMRAGANCEHPLVLGNLVGGLRKLGLNRSPEAERISQVAGHFSHG